MGTILSKWYGIQAMCDGDWCTVPGQWIGIVSAHAALADKQSRNTRDMRIVCGTVEVVDVVEYKEKERDRCLNTIQVIRRSLMSILANVRCVVTHMRIALVIHVQNVALLVIRTVQSTAVEAVSRNSKR